MPGDLSVALTLKQRDELSGPLRRTLGGVVEQSREATRSVDAIADASVRGASARAQASTQAERAIQRSVSESVTAYAEKEKAAIGAERTIARETNRAIDERLRAQAEFNAALRTLNVRTEHEIQGEIERTQRAYERLAESGQLSAAEQARAFGSMRTTVAELNAEMGRLSRTERGIQFGQRIGGGAMRAGELALAGVAATHAVVGPAGRAMDYDKSLALMANTAFNEEGAAGRIRGMKELNEVVKKTIAAGGGTPEEVVQAMTQMLGQNAISHQSVFRLMPLLQRYATGTGSDTTELGDVAMRSIQTFGIREDQIQDVLDASIKGGHMGGFHLRQMAKWLPQQMASAKNAGMTGMDGIASLIALNEVSMTTAGTADEAGNNTLDLLQHLNSQDTARKIHKELGATLAVRYANSIEHGKGPLEAFSGLIEQVMARDKNYQILQNRIASTKDDGEKRQLYERMEQVISGSAIGKVIHNRQEMLAMMGYLNNRDRYNQIKSSVLNARGMGEADAQVMESTDSFKTQRAKSLAELGEFDSLRGFDKVVGNAADRVTEYAQKYPGLMSAIMGAKVAFEGLNNVLLTVGLMRFVTGHGAGAAERGAAKAGSSALGSIARGALKEGGVLARLMKPAGSSALSLLMGGAEAWQTARDDTLTGNEKKSEYTRIAGHTAGGFGGWLGGAAAGAAIGSAVPVVGTAAGGIIGGLLGGLGGDLLGDKLGKMLGDAIFKAEAAKPAPQPANVNVKVDLDGRQIYESLNQISLEAARRH